MGSHSESLKDRNWPWKDDRSLQVWVCWLRVRRTLGQLARPKRPSSCAGGVISRVFDHPMDVLYIVVAVAGRPIVNEFDKLLNWLVQENRVIFILCRKWVAAVMNAACWSQNRRSMSRSWFSSATLAAFSIVVMSSAKWVSLAERLRCRSRRRAWPGAARARRSKRVRLPSLQRRPPRRPAPTGWAPSPTSGSSLTSGQTVRSPRFAGAWRAPSSGSSWRARASRRSENYAGRQ